VAVVDAEQVRAAVTVALDASMESLVEEIARRVTAALESTKPAAPAEAAKPVANLPLPDDRGTDKPAVRRVTSLRTKTNSILGLDYEAETPK
jgi:hypothetical protein